MIEWYDPAGVEDEAGFGYLVARARAALGRDEGGQAVRLLVAALRQAHVREDEYARAAALLRDAYAGLGRYREALTVEWYRTGAQPGRAPVAEGLLRRALPSDQARTLLLTGEVRRAAEAFESAGLLVRAAIAFEQSREWGQARALWSRLAQSLCAAPSDLYAAALAQFNLFRTSHLAGDARAARAASVAATHLLEEAADRLETSGLRERAFDCYQVLISIGRQTGVFEHVLEGYVNILRILQEDHLRYYALQTYEEAVIAARNEGEFVAAATLAREMAAYARKQGEPAVANYATMAEASLWQGVAKASGERGAPPSLVENALLAAVASLGELGQYRSVGALYTRLGELAAEERRRTHYARAGRRYADAHDERVDAQPLPAHLRHEAGFPDVWHVDLIEWEQQGSAAEACADVLLEPGPSADVTRRRALVGRLVALSAEADPSSGRAALLVCGALEHLELYGILAPLEALARRPEAEVRAAALKALSRFLYKRTFVTVRAGLADESPEVVRAATSALEQLRFPHAFDPLARVYREATRPEVRHAALRALGRIELVEAAELLVGVLAFGAADDRRVVVQTLKESRGRVFVEVANAALGETNATARGAIREILNARGIAPERAPGGGAN
ncbi:MAG TPA: HEAT repeat domain-containing protein [Polyangiaceae bacterium]|nr:HEAT repeat domain-containing protein [Polyangiaceae bacterium]